jgi:hypothetical protein
VHTFATPPCTRTQCTMLACQHRRAASFHTRTQQLPPTDMLACADTLLHDSTHSHTHTYTFTHAYTLTYTHAHTNTNNSA